MHSKVNALGLRSNPKPIIDLINKCKGDLLMATQLVKDEYGLELIERQRIPHSYKKHHPLVEVWDEKTPENAYLVSPEMGFFIVAPNRSVVFVSRNHGNSNVPTFISPNRC